MNDQIKTRLTFNLISEYHILNVINRLNNKASYGHDNISNKLIKRAKEKLLTIPINQMLTTSKFHEFHQSLKKS